MRNVWVVHFGMIACAAIIPLALIAGPIRGIPLGWRLVDVSFGVIPLLFALSGIRRLERVRTDVTAEGVPA